MAVFTAYLFDGSRTAQKVLDALEDSPNAYVWIDDVAVVSKKEDGRLKIHSTWAQDETGKTGFGWGAFTGGLLGLMINPAAALAGAAVGGSLWGLFGLGVDEIVDDPELDKFGKELKKDTSALVLVTQEGYENEYETALTPFNGKLIQTNLDETDVKYIKDKIKHATK
ncbi:MAG: hypothetical protein DSZ12_04465 [Sulfurovum sp.]|nr:MAG: hypothetical protein DSZ08_01585 [Sulfurovum sp.]RUM75034.1 MAG: hypothetical protein DSZ12_04465 [Sulfurovum sp.]